MAASSRRSKPPGPPQGAPEPDLQLNPRLEFMRVLWALDHALQSTSKRLEARVGVTGPQRLVVRIVGRFPDVSAGELASILVTHPSTLSGVLKRLETRGLIERRIDPTDARRAQFRLTRKGKEIDELRAGTVEAAVQRLISTTPEAELETTQRVLRALAAELDQLQ